MKQIIITVIICMTLIGQGAQAKFNRNKALRDFNRFVIGTWDVSSLGSANNKRIFITGSQLSGNLILFSYSVVSNTPGVTPITLERDKVGFFDRGTMFIDILQADIAATFKNRKLRNDVLIGIEFKDGLIATVNLKRGENNDK